MFQPTGYDLYNSLQIRLQKRYSNGLSFLGAYTLSKNIGFGGSDTFGDVFGGGGNKGIDTFNRKLERSLENIDRTHVFVFSWTYELPFGRNKRIGNNWNPVFNHILGGWQINSIERYQSETPLRVRGGPGLPLFGGSNRPNWVSPNVRSSVDMGSFDPAQDRYLNIDAFSRPAPFTIVMMDAERRPRPPAARHLAIFGASAPRICAIDTPSCAFAIASSSASGPWKWNVRWT